MTVKSLNSKDEAEILDLMEQWRRAAEAKDSTALVEHYGEEPVLFDAIPPYKVVGRDAIQKSWDHCLPFMPDRFRCEHRDVVVHVGGDVALAHAMHRFVPEQGDHPCGKNWLRVTIGFKRIEGRWRVVHEHISLPFNPMTDQVWPITDLAVLDTPDYAACGQE